MNQPPVTALPARALVAQQLACRRGRRLLFSGLNLALDRGSLLWLRGTNGSGKTSLMRMLAGLAPVEAGTISYGGVPIAKARADWHAALVYIGHTNALKDDLTLAEALAFQARLHGRHATPESVLQALGVVGIDSRAQALVRTLSQGQRRRGALARLALDDEARTWILDEPFDALDREGIERLNGLILANVARGGSVLLTSHQAVALPGLVEFDLETVRAAPGHAAARALQ
jgi:heme exporter protein A